MGQKCWPRGRAQPRPGRACSTNFEILAWCSSASTPEPYPCGRTGIAPVSDIVWDGFSEPLLMAVDSHLLVSQVDEAGDRRDAGTTAWMRLICPGSGKACGSCRNCSRASPRRASRGFEPIANPSASLFHAWSSPNPQGGSGKGLLVRARFQLGDDRHEFIGHLLVNRLQPWLGTVFRLGP